MTLPAFAFPVDEGRVRVGIRDQIDRHPTLRQLVDTVLDARARAIGASGHSFEHVDRKYVQLGSLEYHLVGPVVGLESSHTFDYAEHTVVEGKPRLQFVGSGLDTLTLSLALHEEYCDPDLEMLALETAAAEHQAMPLVWASGSVRGRYVIAQLDETIHQTDALGRRISSSVRVALKEWTEEVVFEVATPARASRATKRTGGKPAAVAPAPAAVAKSLNEMLAEASVSRRVASPVPTDVPTSVITRRP